MRARAVYVRAWEDVRQRECFCWICFYARVIDGSSRYSIDGWVTLWLLLVLKLEVETAKLASFICSVSLWFLKSLSWLVKKLLENKQDRCFPFRAT